MPISVVWANGVRQSLWLCHPASDDLDCVNLTSGGPKVFHKPGLRYDDLGPYAKMVGNKCTQLFVSVARFKWTTDTAKFRNYKRMELAHRKNSSRIRVGDVDSKLFLHSHYKFYGVETHGRLTQIETA